MKLIFTSLLITLITTISAFSQTTANANFRDRFNKYIEAKDTVFAKSVLSDWTEVSPNDPEIFVAYLNYFFLKSIKDVAFLADQKPKDTEMTSFPMTDSTGKVTGYIVSGKRFDPDMINKGIEYIKRGIDKYPDRLDMRFSEIYVLGRVKRWSEFASETISMIEHSKSNNNAWQWIDGKMLDAGEDNMMIGVSDFQQQLYTQDTVGVNIRNIANVLLLMEPKSIEALNYMAVSYIKEGDFKKALQFLKKAEKIDKSDMTVLKNMVVVYKKSGDEKKSQEYLSKLKKIQAESVATENNNLNGTSD